jgi:hypothetical protein
VVFASAVMLLGRNGADQADQGVAVREDLMASMSRPHWCARCGIGLVIDRVQQRLGRGQNVFDVADIRFAEY